MSDNRSYFGPRTGTGGAVGDASAQLPLATKTASYSAATGHIVPFNTTGGNISQTLPAALVNNSWQAINIGTANTLTLSPAGGDSIRDTSPTSLPVVLNAGESMSFFCFSTGVWSRV